MLEKTDEDHRLTVNEILAELEKYDVTAERKTIYKDMEALEVMDIEIGSEKRRSLELLSCHKSAI